MISVIVPAYNVLSYLRQCVDSILAQTFNDFELILVDDGSLDNCGAICDEYAEQDGRVQAIHQQNKGQAAARNRALPCSSGDWICFVDSDDLIHREMLRLLYEEAVRSKAKIVGCGFEEAEVPSENFYAEPRLPFEITVISEITLEQLYRTDNAAYWCVWGKLIARDVVETIPMTEGRFYEDNEVMCKWLFYAKNISLTNNRMYFYRINPNGTTKSPFSYKQLDFLWALTSMMRFYHGIEYYTMENIIASRYLWAARGMYIKLYNELSDKKRASYLRKEMRKKYSEYRNRNYLKKWQKRAILIIIDPVYSYARKIVAKAFHLLGLR